MVVASILSSVSQHSVMQWFQFFRDACTWYLQNFRQHIGGVGQIMSGTNEAMLESHLDEFMFRDWMDLAAD